MRTPLGSLAEFIVRVREKMPEQGRRGRLLAFVLLITFFLDLLLLLANLWSWRRSGSDYDRNFFLLEVFGLFFLIGLWLLNRGGQTRSAAVLLLAAYFVRIGLIHDPERFANVFWAYAFPIILSSFILKPIFSFPAAGASIVIYLLIASNLGFSEPLDITIFKVIGLFALASFPYLTASHLEWAVDTTDRSEAKYHNLFNNLPIGLYRTSPEGKILDVNAAFLEMFGFPDGQAIETIQAADMYADPSSRRRYLSIVEDAHTTEMEMRRPDGRTIWVSDHVSPVRDEAGEVVCYEGSLIDITERKQAIDQLEQLAISDPLTGIFNRRHFFSQAEAIFQRSRQPPYELSLLMIDLDHFKDINDKHGHASGDLVLREVAHRIHASLRSCDLLGRYGGEEFAVLLSRIGRGNTHRLAERVRNAVAADPVRVGQDGIHVTISIGVARLEKSIDKLDLLLQRADQALYQAKNSGRNKWVEWAPGMKTGG